MIEKDLPRRHRNKPIPDDNGPWRVALDTLMGSSGGTVVICGDRGRGKTQLCVWVAQSLVRKGRSVSFYKAYDFFSLLRSGFKTEAGERAMIDKMCGPTLLIVDGIEQMSGSEYEMRVLTHIVDVRYDACKTTFLVTNHKFDSLQEHLGSSITSRMTETGTVINCDWDGFREVSK